MVSKIAATEGITSGLHAYRPLKYVASTAAVVASVYFHHHIRALSQCFLDIIQGLVIDRFIEWQHDAQLQFFDSFYYKYWTKRNSSRKCIATTDVRPSTAHLTADSAQATRGSMILSVDSDTDAPVRDLSVVRGDDGATATHAGDGSDLNDDDVEFYREHVSIMDAIRQYRDEEASAGTDMNVMTEQPITWLDVPLSANDITRYDLVQYAAALGVANDDRLLQQRCLFEVLLAVPTQHQRARGERERDDDSEEPSWELTRTQDGLRYRRPEEVFETFPLIADENLSLIHI